MKKNRRGFVPGIRPGKPTSRVSDKDIELHCLYRCLLDLSIVAGRADTALVDVLGCECILRWYIPHHYRQV